MLLTGLAALGSNQEPVVPKTTALPIELPAKEG
jgi:hypothetical protein